MTEGQKPRITPEQRNDVLNWAKEPVVYCDWLRKYCPEANLDSEKIIIAEVCYRAGADDNNIFGFSNKFDDSRRELAGEQIAIRIEWEIESQETPAAIKEVLKKLWTGDNDQQGIQNTNWRDKDEFDAAKNRWLETRQVVSDIADSDPEIIEAVEYSKSMQSKIRELRNLHKLD